MDQTTFNDGLRVVQPSNRNDMRKVSMSLSASIKKTNQHGQSLQTRVVNLLLVHQQSHFLSCTS
eukprot:scaffold77091_cov17-Tisochrysis_lutea.AAC.1